MKKGKNLFYSSPPPSRTLWEPLVQSSLCCLGLETGQALCFCWRNKKLTLNVKNMVKNVNAARLVSYSQCSGLKEIFVFVGARARNLQNLWHICAEGREGRECLNRNAKTETHKSYKVAMNENEKYFFFSLMAFDENRTPSTLSLAYDVTLSSIISCVRLPLRLCVIKR